MKIYTGKNKKESKEISFENLLIRKLYDAGFNLHIDSFEDENSSWIDIIQQSENHQITLVVCFDTDIDKIDSINVYKADIITTVDKENERKLI